MNVTLIIIATAGVFLEIMVAAWFMNNRTKQGNLRGKKL